MVRLILFALALSAAGAAQAAPVNLQCDVMQGGKQTSVDITLNEANRSMTWQWAGDPKPVSGPADFTATKVVMKTITIDRTDLSFVQSYDYGDGLVVNKGKCKKVVVNRAF